MLTRLTLLLAEVFIRCTKSSKPPFIVKRYIRERERQQLFSSVDNVRCICYGLLTSVIGFSGKKALIVNSNKNSNSPQVNDLLGR